MEDALRDLRQVMAAHRTALTEAQAWTAAHPSDPPADECRQALIRGLARDIERVSGIEIGGSMQAKLGRVLASAGLAELAGWAGRLRLLPADHPEWLSLIEALTVHETFFHRDRSQLALLAQILRDMIAVAAAAGRCRLRLWSAGCATGEEAYTLAIAALSALRDAGCADETGDGAIECRPPWRLDVLGTDISRLVLAQAEAAVYGTEGLSPFRELPGELQRFFPTLPAGGGAGGAERRAVSPAVRRHVRFRQFNLMAEAPPETGFDIVLCRNVLMYFTGRGRVAAQRVLRRGLRPGGWLLLGPTDALAEPAAYEPRWGAAAVAYALQATQ